MSSKSVKKGGNYVEANRPGSLLCDPKTEDLRSHEFMTKNARDFQHDEDDYVLDLLVMTILTFVTLTPT